MGERNLRAMTSGWRCSAPSSVRWRGRAVARRHGLDAYGATTVGIGVAVIAAATQIHRAPWLRWVLASLAMAVLFSPFAFPTDDISDREVYYSTMVGFMVLMSSIVSVRMFTQEPSERTSGERRLEVVGIEHLEREHAVELTIDERPQQPFDLGARGVGQRLVIAAVGTGAVQLQDARARQPLVDRRRAARGRRA